MVKFIKIIKDIINGKNRSVPDLNNKNFVEQVVSNAKFGDIILTNIYENDYLTDDKDVFVVVGKTSNELLGYFCETLKNNDIASLNKHKLFKNNGNILMPFILKKIDEKSFYKKLNKLSYSDSEKLVITLKYHYLEYEDVFNDPNMTILFNPLIRIRDVVKMNDNYYLILNSVVHTNIFTDDIADEKFLLLPINKYDSTNFDPNSVQCDKAIRGIESESNLIYAGTITKDQYGLVAKKYCQYNYRKNELERAKGNNIIKKGYIIEYNSKYYYVYNVSGNNAYAFLISITDKNFSLVAGNTTFIPFFENQLKINIKNDEYNFFDVAYSNEVSDIENEKNKYFRNLIILEKGLDKERKVYNYNVGDVVRHVDFLGLKFIVVGVYYDKLITIHFDEFIKNAKIIYNEFMVRDKYLYLSDDLDDNDKTIINDNIDVFNSLYKNFSFKNRKLTKY